MKRFFLVVCLLASACSRKESGETHSAFDAASGVTRAGTAGKPHIVPLHAMSGDVEILSGDPDKAGEPFVMRINELPGTKIPLHSHPVDENITVVQGTWYFAVADKWDRAALTPLRAGDYAFAPKGSTMFAYCPDGAIVQVHGIVCRDSRRGSLSETLRDVGEAGPLGGRHDRFSRLSGSRAQFRRSKRKQAA